MLARFTLEPGAGIPFEAEGLTVALAYVESGALTARVEAPIRVTRGAAPQAAEGPPPQEEIAAGTEFTLEAGDSAVFPPNVPGEIRNDGQEPVVGLVALVAPPEGGEATPVAGAATG